MTNQNWNCDGNKCTSPNGEVRLYPTGGGGNLNLCRACWANENRFRYQQRKKYPPENWPDVDWNTATVTNERRLPT